MTNTPISKDELRARADKGAAWLDTERPGWEHLIDLGDLHMDRCDACIVGQAIGNFWRTVYAAAAGGKSIKDMTEEEWSQGGRWAIDRGFHLRYGAPEDWATLEEVWTEIVKERVNA